MPPKIFILLIIPNLIEFANANLLNELKFYILLKIKTFPQNRKVIPTSYYLFLSLAGLQQKNLGSSSDSASLLTPPSQFPSGNH